MCPLHMSGRFTLRAGPGGAARSACRAVCPHALREEGFCCSPPWEAPDLREAQS